MNKIEIANLAMQEAQSHSFEKVSMQSLADKLGVKKASFYYHFPSKQALAVAVIENARSQLMDYFAFHKKRSPEHQIEAYIKLFAKHMQPIKNLCPGAGFIATWPNQDESVQHAIKDLYETHTTYLKQTIEQGVSNGVFASTLNAEESAKTVFCLLQGSLLAARVEASLSVFDTSSSAIHYLLKGA